MIELKTLAVKNYGPFVNQATFHFKPGLSVVYGLNQTSGKYSKNSNWVGKSLFFNSLSEILYDEPIVGLKQDKIKDGVKACILQSGKDKIQVIKKLGKRESIQILKNGTPIDYLTKTKANDFIHSVWKLSKAEFETFVHLDSRVPHPLVMGTSTERKHFFDSFFKLDAIDYERKLYLAKLRELKASKAAYDELKASYSIQAKQVIPDDEYEDMVEELQVLKRKQKSLQKKLQQSQQYQQLKALYDTLPIDSLPCELSEVSDALEKANAELNELKQVGKDIVRYSVYRNSMKEYEQMFNALSDLAKSTDPEKLKKGSALYRKSLARYESLQEDEFPDLYKPEKVRAVSYDLDTLLGKKAEYEHVLEHIEKFKSGICPTCKQPVKIQDRNAVVQEYSEVLKQINAVKRYQNYQAALAEYEKEKARADRLIWELESAKAKCNKFEKYHSAYEEIVSLPSKPASVSRPALNKKAYESKLKQVQDAVNCLSTVEPHLSSIEQYLNWSGEKEFNYTEFNKIQSKIAEIEAKLSVNKKARESLKEIAKRLRELKAVIKDQPYIEKLIEIFSDKQIKKAMVQQISTRFCALLNKYSMVVFNNDYRFNLVWDTQIQLLCSRRVGNQVLTSDVRKLSGAESKLFTIILILALLSFVPSSRRPSVMILDEPSANFSTETTHAFMRLLDILKKVVKSIVIITPRDDIYPDSTCYTVVRTRKGSVIKQGLPDELL